MKEENNINELNKYKILISQDKPNNSNSPYFKLADNFNLELDFEKFVKILPISSIEFRKFIPRITQSTSVIFTSRIAIDHFFSLCGEVKLEIDDNMKYFCITPQIANYLQNYINYKKRKVFSGKKSVLDLVPFFKKYSKENYLFPCSESKNNTICSFFKTSKKKNLNLVPVLNTVPRNLSHVNLHNYSLITLFSPADINSLTNNFDIKEFKNLIFATFGSSTTRELQKLGLKATIEAPSVKAPSMAKAMNLYFEGILKRLT